MSDATPSTTDGHGPTAATSSARTDEALPPGRAAWRDRWYHIIFGHDTRAGKLFDAWLLAAILVSVFIIMIDSVESIHARYRVPLLIAEWFFTLLFTVEYIVRLAVAPSAWRYARSFYGIVDLLSVLPTYLIGFADPSVQRLSTVRALRLLRAFRIFKLRSMLTEADALQQALVQSRAKVAVFLSAVLIAVTIAGSALHLIEADTPGFESIPKSMYFTIVTMSTVGYGDISPQTTGGRILTTAIILLGYSLIVVPTGIVSAEISRSGGRDAKKPRTCSRCDHIGHDADARYCKLCGERLPKPTATAAESSPQTGAAPTPH